MEIFKFITSFTCIFSMFAFMAMVFAHIWIDNEPIYLSKITASFFAMTMFSLFLFSLADDKKSKTETETDETGITK